MNEQTNFHDEATKSLQNQTTTNRLPITKQTTLMSIKSLLSKEELKNRFNEILKQKSPGFVASIISLVSGSQNFDGCEPNSVIAGALIAATLDLPINPNLGFAYIIPYNSSSGKKAQFQMGYKALIQLALRTGQYKTINATEVYEGELIKHDRLSGELILDETKQTSKTVIGYAAHFKLINGFEKSLYMTVGELMEHGKKYSKSFSHPSGLWKTNPHVMMLKTVLKFLLSKYGILSVQLEQGIVADQSTPVETEDGIVYDYDDNPQPEIEEAVISQEVPEGKPEQKTEVKQPEKPTEEVAKTDNPMWWVKQINEITNAIHLKNFKKKYKKDIDMFSGTDAEAINEAYEAKENSFKG